MLLFIIETITSILGVCGFFQYNNLFMQIGLWGFLICTAIGLWSRQLRTITPDIIAMLLGVVLSAFVERTARDCIILSLCACTLLFGVVGVASTVIMLKKIKLLEDKTQK